MRVRAEWLFCSAFLLSMTGCGSTKHSADTDAGDNDAATAAEGGKGSTATGGSHAAAGSGTTSAGNTGGNSNQSGNGGTSEDDAGVNSGSGGASAAGSGAAGQSGGAGSTATTLPSDGNQLALCTMAQGDCNKGFACYSPATAFSAGRGFCSKICTMQSDCDGLEPASTKYTCPTGNGTKVCEATCTGTDDTSCPSDMTCQETTPAVGGMGMGMGMGMGGGGDGGSGGTKAVFHCKYPLETSPVWGKCGDGTHSCDKGLTCQGLTVGRSGYCSQSCDMDSDCSKPSTGKATPTCVEIIPARGMTKAVKACSLSCADAKNGCPDGETCVDGPKDKDGKAAYSRCEF